MIAPIKPNNKNVAADLDKLDPSQREAVESEDKNIVIKAPAGSGKALDNNTNVLTSTG